MLAGAVLLSSLGCAHLPVQLNDAPASAESCRQLDPTGAPQPRWIGPTHAGSRVRLSRWCDTVGPVFFAPGSVSVFPRPHVDRLAIVSWNIHEGHGDVDEVVRRLRRGEFTSGEPIDQFVLLLQEVTRRGDGVPSRVPHGYPAPRRIGAPAGATSDVRHFAEEGFAVLYAPSMRNGATRGEPEDRGNAIVSTLPLAHPVLIELPLEHQRRVAVVASSDGWRMDGSPWHLTFVDVHLDTALAWFHGGPFAARRRQAMGLVDGLSRLSELPDLADAAVVAGDFNSWMGGHEAAVELVRRQFPVVVSADSGTTWSGPLGLGASLDHIFARGPVTARSAARLPSRFGSDHYPLLTVIEF